MRVITLMYIDRDEEVCQTMKRVISKQEGWKGIVVQTNEEAQRNFTESTFDIVLLGSGIDADSEQNLRSFFKSISPKTPVIQHYGGGSGLLLSEVYSTLS